MSPVQNIFRHARQFLSGTLLSKCFGVLRDVSFAYAFGASSAIASFMVAFRLAHFFRRFIGESGLSVAFIPHFEKKKETSEKDAALFFRDLLVYFALFLLAFVIILSLGFMGTSKLLTQGGSWSFIAQLTAIMSLSLFFIGLYALNQAYLQTQGVFFVAASAPIGFNICAISGALLAHSQTFLSPYIFLAAMVTLGFALQWLWTLPLTIRFLSPYLRSAFFKGLTAQSLRESRLFRSAGLGLVGIAAVQMNSIIDGVFAKLVDSSGPAFLWYAVRIYQLPLSLFAVSMASALLPSLSKASQSPALFREYLTGVMRKVMLFMIPCTLAILVLGSSGIELLYGRGHFAPISALNTYYCLLGYGVGLVGSCVVIVLAQAFYAKGDYLTPSKAALSAVLTNLFLNLVFIYGLKMGSFGIALATGVSTSVNALILQQALKKKMPEVGQLVERAFLKKVCFSSVCAAFGVIGISFYQQDFFYASFVTGIQPAYLGSFGAQLGSFSFKAVGFMALFVTLGYLFNISEVKFFRKTAE